MLDCQKVRFGHKISSNLSFDGPKGVFKEGTLMETNIIKKTLLSKPTWLTMDTQPFESMYLLIKNSVIFHCLPCLLEGLRSLEQAYPFLQKARLKHFWVDDFSLFALFLSGRFDWTRLLISETAMTAPIHLLRRFLGWIDCFFFWGRILRHGGLHWFMLHLLVTYQPLILYWIFGKLLQNSFKKRCKEICLDHRPL